MNPKRAFLASLTLIIAAAAMGEPGPGAALPADALARVDSYRSFGGGDFSFDFATMESDGGSSLMRVSLRLGRGLGPGPGGSDAALVKYLEPRKERGRIVLVSGEAFWLYEPGMNKSIRISPRQLLFGQASAGDISRIGYRNMYRIRSSERSGEGWELGLEAEPGTGATYDAVRLRVGAALEPISAQCLGKSGSIMKTIVYDGYETVEGRRMLTSFLIEDEASGKTTRAKLSNFSLRVEPASSFNVQALPGLR